MPRRKKKAAEMTDAELERRVFPKKALEELQRVAHEKDDKEGNDSSQDESTS